MPSLKAVSRKQARKVKPWKSHQLNLSPQDEKFLNTKLDAIEKGTQKITRLVEVLLTQIQEHLAYHRKQGHGKEGLSKRLAAKAGQVVSRG